MTCFYNLFNHIFTKQKYEFFTYQKDVDVILATILQIMLKYGFPSIKNCKFRVKGSVSHNMKGGDIRGRGGDMRGRVVVKQT